jgi:hypothetical protein
VARGRDGGAWRDAPRRSCRGALEAIGALVPGGQTSQLSGGGRLFEALTNCWRSASGEKGVGAAPGFGVDVVFELEVDRSGAPASYRKLPSQLCLSTPPSVYVIGYHTPSQWCLG